MSGGTFRWNKEVRDACWKGGEGERIAGEQHQVMGLSERAIRPSKEVILEELSLSRDL